MYPNPTIPESKLTSLDDVKVNNPQAQSSKPTNPRTRNIADLNEAERRVLQHVALVSLYRTRLRHELDLERLLKFVDGKRSIRDRVAGVFSGRQQAGHEWSRGVPLALHQRLQRITAKWEIVPSSSVTDTPRFIPRILDTLVSTIFSSGPEDAWKRGGYAGEPREVMRWISLGHDHEQTVRDSALVENLGLLSYFADYMRELEIWMDDYGLPFSSVISQALFDDDDHEQRLLFRLLMLLLPSPNRDIVEVLLLTTLRMTEKISLAKEEYDSCDENLVENVHYSLHPELPQRLYAGISELFCIPEEAQAILSEPALMEHFSEKGISTKELLQRCNTYLDLHVPNASMIFTSLHFTESMWSLHIDVADGVAGEQGLDPDGAAVETLAHE